MNNNIVIVNPASGDGSTSLFAGPDASDTILESVPKGTVLKVTGTAGNFYTVEYDNGSPNVFHGGTEMIGTIVAYPSTSMYSDRSKTSVIGTINNGTCCEILDDLHPSMIEVEAITTNGKITGYVEAKFIYCDNGDEAPVARTFNLRMTRSTPDIDAIARDVIAGKYGNGQTRKEKLTAAGYDYEAVQNRVNEILRGGSSSSGGSSGTGGEGTVTAKSGLKARSGPGTNYDWVGAFNYGAKLTIHETKSGWHRVTGTSGWGDLTDVWVSATYVNVTGSSSEAAVPKEDVTPVASDGDDWVTAVSNFSANNLTLAGVDDEYYRKLAIKYSNALGSPPKYNSTIDVRYMEIAENMDDTSSCGRVVNKTLLSNPSILSICPGKVKMFPNLMGTEYDGVVEAMIKAADSSGNTTLRDKIKENDPGRFSGRLYKFEADTEEYAKYLNALCRSCAILLGIGDETMPGTDTKLKHFDYAYWTIRHKYNPTAAKSEVGDGSLFRNFGPGLLDTAKSIVTGAVDDTCYINFFLNGAETSISESITNNVTDGPLANVLNTVSSVAAQINYFTGSGFDVCDSDIGEAIEAIAGDGFTGLKNLAENFMNGGRMVLPKMVEGSSFGKAISCNMRFVSPYGSRYSVFLRCLVPICHLIALAFPRQLSDNMYKYPFLIRCAQTGHFNVDLGIITSLTINRGGNDDTSWTVDTLTTEWDVTLEITPLIDQMMITSTSNPILMVKNEMLLDYLGNFCGFDLYANNLETKVDLLMAFVLNKFAGIPHAIENKLSDKLYNLISPFFKLSS